MVYVHGETFANIKSHWPSIWPVIDSVLILLEDKIVTWGLDRSVEEAVNCKESDITFNVGVVSDEYDK